MVKSSNGSFKRVSVKDAIVLLDTLKKEGKNKFTFRDIKDLHKDYSLGRINGIIRKLSDRNMIRFLKKERVKGDNTTRYINKFEVV